jgi:nucleoside 2-deoxyribosyltransferase
MHKIYIAAPWVHKDRMPEIAAKFEAQGHLVTHKWWEVEGTGPYSDDEREHFADADRDGVLGADILVLINSAKSEGKATEQGMAIAAGIPIVAVGKLGDQETKNIFHYLTDCYHWVETVEEAVNACGS